MCAIEGIYRSKGIQKLCTLKYDAVNVKGTIDLNTSQLFAFTGPEKHLQ